LEQNRLWSWFVEEIKRAVQLSASAARVQNALQKSILFHDRLKELLCKTSPELAKSISLVDVYSQVEDVIDFIAVGQKVGEEINNVTSSISELVQKVKSRMIICDLDVKTCVLYVLSHVFIPQDIPESTIQSPNPKVLLVITIVVPSPWFLNHAPNVLHLLQSTNSEPHTFG
jgi:hypothetical protein